MGEREGEGGEGHHGDAAAAAVGDRGVGDVAAAAGVDDEHDGADDGAAGAGGDGHGDVAAPQVGQKRPRTTGAVCGAPLKSGSGQCRAAVGEAGRRCRHHK